MQFWKKVGHVFNVNGESEWLSSHAMMPCVVPYSADFVQVYFSPRDAYNRSRPASLLLNPQTLEIKDLSRSPLLELGVQGSFDDAGVMPTCIYTVGDVKYMAFNGWCLGRSVPFYSFNGLARYDGSSFSRLENFPNLLNRSFSDPYSTFAPFILNCGGRWLMWYVSLVKWEKAKHYYHIKVATSVDGVKWSPENLVCIDFKDEHEYAIARPVVLYEQNVFKMWFSARATSKVDKYRIYYAESVDGVSWRRLDDIVFLDVSESGWDSEMVCYGYVFDHADRRYMLYNGNGYGATGFGLAVLDY